jgi:hypothetical protein
MQFERAKRSRNRAITNIHFSEPSDWVNPLEILEMPLLVSMFLWMASCRHSESGRMVGNGDSETSEKTNVGGQSSL